jgi:hypothetical protein
MIVDRSTTRPSAPPAFHLSTDPTARAARIGSTAPSYHRRMVAEMNTSSPNSHSSRI